jgi:hypothetical protein
VAALAAVPGASAAKPKKPPVVAVHPSAPIALAPKPIGPFVPTLTNLMSATDREVKERLGAPDMARREETSAMWTYVWSDCALMVFFKSPDGRTLRVSGASAGPRRRAQTNPTVDACLAQNHTRAPKQDEAAIDALLADPH